MEIIWLFESCMGYLFGVWGGRLCLQINFWRVSPYNLCRNKQNSPSNIYNAQQSICCGGGSCIFLCGSVASNDMRRRLTTFSICFIHVCKSWRMTILVFCLGRENCPTCLCGALCKAGESSRQQESEKFNTCRTFSFCNSNETHLSEGCWISDFSFQRTATEDC